MKDKKRMVKRAVTLVELLVVMALIAIISGALAINYRGSLTKGKRFKTEQLIERIHTAVMLEMASDPKVANDFQDKWKDIVLKSPLVAAKVGTNGEILDAWDRPVKCTLDKGVVTVTSDGYNDPNNQ